MVIQGASALTTRINRTFPLSIFQRFFGSSNDRKVKSMSARVAKITALRLTGAPHLKLLRDFLDGVTRGIVR